MSTKFKFLSFGTDMLTAAEVGAAITAATTGKQDALTAGEGIVMSGNTISAVVKAVDNALNASSNNPVANAVIVIALNGKQDKLTAGANITIDAATNTISASGGSSITVDSAMSSTSENPVQNKVITAALGEKQHTLTAGTGITIVGNTISSTGGVTIDTGISSTSTNPVQNKVISQALDQKQNTLTAGANITIDPVTNTISATGGGGGGGGSITVDSAMSSVSTNPVQNKVITAALSGKQNTLTAGGGISIVGNVITLAEGALQYNLVEIEGYYSDGVFYSDSTLTTPIVPTAYRVYKDVTTNILYQYFSSAYHVLGFSEKSYVDNEILTVKSMIDSASEYAAHLVDEPLVDDADV